MNADPPIAGLILAGGHSRRMQRDKASLAFKGESQLSRAMRLIAPFVEHSYVSVRSDQMGDPERARWSQIVDRLGDVGPIAGILAALETRPTYAWLVVAVDLPLLDHDTLGDLLAGRRPGCLATAYTSSVDGLPEPLCAIWEPKSHGPLAAFLASGRQCPRKFLLTHDVQLLNLRSPQALSNVNTPEEYDAVMRATPAESHP